MRIARKIAAGIFLLFALIFGYGALTVPAIAATSYAVVTLICLLVTWVAWPRKRAN